MRERPAKRRVELELDADLLAECDALALRDERSLENYINKTLRRAVFGCIESAGLSNEEWQAYCERLRATATRLARRPLRAERNDAFRRSEGKCHYCGGNLDPLGDWHVDHVHPHSQGGDSSPENLVAACRPCNLAKGDRPAADFSPPHVKRGQT